MVGITQMLFSPDGSTVVLHHGRGVSLVETATKRKHWTTALHPTTPATLVFSHEGRLLLVGSGSAIFVVDVATGKRLGAAWDRTTPPQSIDALAVTPDGLRLLSLGGQDDKILVWKLRAW
jgi:WD40 repeat protein